MWSIILLVNYYGMANLSAAHPRPIWPPMVGFKQGWIYLWRLRPKEIPDKIKTFFGWLMVSMLLWHISTTSKSRAGTKIHLLVSCYIKKLFIIKCYRDHNECFKLVLKKVRNNSLKCDCKKQSRYCHTVTCIFTFKLFQAQFDYFLTN